MITVETVPVTTGITQQVSVLGAFPDNTPLIKIIEAPSNFYRVIWKYEGMEELFTVYSIGRHIKLTFPQSLTELSMPYIPNARMDREEDFKDVFTLKYFAEIINAAKFDNVKVLDPHSDVSTALIDAVSQIPVSPIVEKAITASNTDIQLAFYPDAGAAKRYSKLIKLPYAYGSKNRDWETGEIKSLEISGVSSDIEGKNIMIIDDICSAGGTFYYSAKKLKEIGAGKIFLYVSHLENTILEHMDRLEGLIEHIFTTDSIFTGNHEKITIVEMI